MKRTVVLTGSFQYKVPNTLNWDVYAEGTRMEHIGEDIYTLTIKDIPAGEHQYKIAVNSWKENYGQGGILNGFNVILYLYKNSDVTFYYSDKSHHFCDSTQFMPLLGDDKPKLNINEIIYTLEDYNFAGVYSAEVELDKGEYNNLVIRAKEEEIYLPAFNLEAKKKISFFYDSPSKLAYCNAFDRKIDNSLVYYNSASTIYKKPFGAVAEKEDITVKIRAKKNDVEECRLVVIGFEKKYCFNLEKEDCYDDDFDYWYCDFYIEEKGVYKYYFVFSNYYDIKFYGDNDGFLGEGICGDIKDIKPYYITIYDKNFKTPDWMKNAVVYQIFPDRFYDGDTSNRAAQKTGRGFIDYEFYQDWYAIPENPALEHRSDYVGVRGRGIWSNQIYGGDLRGVQEKLDYLQALGVNTIYLNPISKSISSHRYDTTYYKEVDPLLGDIKDFEELVEEAHNRGMHVILDGVFNHVSDDSIYFDKFGKYIKPGQPLGAYQYWSRVYSMMEEYHICQEEAESHVQENFKRQGIYDFHYKDWFKVENRKEHGSYKYEGWYGYDSMPVINDLYDSEYKIHSWAEEIIDGEDANSKFWLRKGSNGWRLDAAEQMSDETWRHFRKAVKRTGCDYAIIGEIWTDGTKYLLGDMYDSLINYRFTNAVLGFIAGRDFGNYEWNGITTVKLLEQIREQYPEDAFYSMFNLVDSHDTQRAISAIDGYKKGEPAIANTPTERAYRLMKLLALFQVTYPGVPCIYYGDETGLPGADDPDNRRAMPWGRGNKELVLWYSTIINIRNKYDIFRNGYMKWINVTTDFIVFARYNGKEQVVVLLNRGGEMRNYTLDISNAVFCTDKLTDAITGREYRIDNGKIFIDIEKEWGTILVTDYQKVIIDEEKLKDAFSPEFTIRSSENYNNYSA
ncbi:MAG: alpha-amylase family glycosyl hydrolase [Bacillota bacterium]|nr:alpha-amylase family glycosyl hydrolase [Bacillota bacterium]